MLTATLKNELFDRR